MELARIIIDDQPLFNTEASVSGEFRVNRLSTPEEAAAIRKVLQIPERRALTEEQKQALQDRFRKGAVTAGKNKSEGALKRLGKSADTMAPECVSAGSGT